MGPSWSRSSVTSPAQLRELAKETGADPEDYTVCYVTVAAVRSLGLDVVASPTNSDPGHCHISETDDQKFAAKVWSKLAKTTRILTDDQISTLRVGDSVD